MSREEMHALAASDRGGPDRLALAKLAVPRAGIGDVLVRVQAASFTPDELDWPSTWVDRAGRDRRPVVPAHEVAGVVAALGPGTTGLAVGDAVYGLTDWYRDGAAAEYVAVEARNLAAAPATLGPAEAAAVPLAGLTAFQALFDHGRMEGGQTVLVAGAGGGVGTFATQLAHAAGARVVAAGRGWARELVAGLGADVFVDTDRDRLEDAGPVDLVVDMVGGELLERSRAMVRPGGAVVSVVEDVAGGPGVRGVFFIVEPDRAELAELAARVDAGTLRPVVGSVLALADGRRAFQAKLAGGLRGKVALLVADDA